MLNSRMRGVSLIETLVAMVIMMFVLAQVTPMAAEWLQGIRLRNAGESLRAGIERARLESLKRNTSVTFWMVSDPGSKVPGNGCGLVSNSSAWVVSVMNPTGQCGAEASQTAAPQLSHRSVALENVEGVTINAVGATGAAANSVTFTGFGQVDVSGAPIQTIDLTQTNGGGRRLRVVIQSGGAVRMCDPDAVPGDARVCPVMR